MKKSHFLGEKGWDWETPPLIVTKSQQNHHVVKKLGIARSLVGTKSQVFPKICFEGSPYHSDTLLYPVSLLSGYRNPKTNAMAEIIWLHVLWHHTWGWKYRFQLTATLRNIDFSGRNIGECLTKLRGRYWCYVNPNTLCSDKTRSSRSSAAIKLYYSYDACSHQAEPQAATGGKWTLLRFWNVNPLYTT